MTFQELLNSIYKYFHYSPKNMSKLDVIHSVLDANRSRFKQVFHTRWFSFEGLVDAILENYEALVSVPVEENGGKNPWVCTSQSHVISFCVLQISRQMHWSTWLYWINQNKDLDFGEVTPLLSSTVDSLEGLSATPSKKTSRIFEGCTW